MRWIAFPNPIQFGLNRHFKCLFFAVTWYTNRPEGKEVQWLNSFLPTSQVPTTPRWRWHAHDDPAWQSDISHRCCCHHKRWRRNTFGQPLEVQLRHNRRMIRALPPLLWIAMTALTLIIMYCVVIRVLYWDHYPCCYELQWLPCTALTIKMLLAIFSDVIKALHWISLYFGFFCETMKVILLERCIALNTILNC